MICVAFPIPQAAQELTWEKLLAMALDAAKGMLCELRCCATRLAPVLCLCSRGRASPLSLSPPAPQTCTLVTLRTETSNR